MLTVNKSSKSYAIIEQKAGSNLAMQGLSGLLGFPFTTIADVGAVFTHYGPMINDIRKIYGLPEINTKALRPILEGCSEEILSDLLFDKIGGQIPILGIPFNMMCAKAMTWRLGILFTMFAARGQEVNVENTRNATILIRKIFPQTKTFSFSKPSIVIFEKLVNTMENETVEDFNSKVMKILNNLD